MNQKGRDKIIKVRLDQILVDRGLAENRSRALAMIMAGIVRVGDHAGVKGGEMHREDVPVELTGPVHPYVSRGGLKLKHGLEHFSVDVGDAICLDAGASTGGFTHCLLLEGAQKVWAVDVGYGQLDYRLRKDPRVVVVERCNVRYLTEEQVPRKMDIITGDLSFISLTLVLKTLYGFLRPGGLMLLLIKPQFEAPRGSAPRGVVRDPDIRRCAVEKVADFAVSMGLEYRGAVESPITGPKGNVEYIGCFRRSAG